MSVKSILKGAGKSIKKLGSEIKDGAKASSKTIKDAITNEDGKIAKFFNDRKPTAVIGPGDIIQRSSIKNLEDPMALYQQFVPYHLNQKYAVPLALGMTAYSAGDNLFQSYKHHRMGEVISGDGLSGMTVGGIDGMSSNIITPGLKAMQDGSTKAARQKSANIRDNMVHNVSSRGAEGDIVFALHNMR